MTCLAWAEATGQHRLVCLCDEMVALVCHSKANKGAIPKIARIKIEKGTQSLLLPIKCAQNCSLQTHA